jgi:hypothetical protein
MGDIPVEQLAYYVIVAAGGLSLVMALLSLGRMMRAAGFIVLAVGIALLAMWIQNRDILFLSASGVAAFVAFMFMVSGRAMTPADMKGLSTSGR